MKKICWIVFGITLLLTACGGLRPTPEQINSADYGPFPENWKQIVSNAIAEELVRPEELYIRKIEQPIKTWIATPDGEILYVWAVCGMTVMGPTGRGHLEGFVVFIHYDKVVYKALGFDLTKQVPGKTWMGRGIGGKAYDCCPNLFKSF
jgi:hypothetical protein